MTSMQRPEAPDNCEQSGKETLLRAVRSDHVNCVKAAVNS